MTFKQHELSALYPSMPDEELSALADNIKAHGLHDSIVLYQGKVLDGWHRYQACRMVGVNPRTIDFRGKDPASYVESKNDYRRHSTASQRALTKVGLAEWRGRGKPSLNPQDCGIKTTAEMATDAHVSPRSIEHAKVVHEQGSEALKDAVMQGDVGIEKAAAIAKTIPKRAQMAAVNTPAKPAAVKPLNPEVKKLQDEVERLKDELAETKDALAEVTGIASAADA
jgi:hypothetical protein